MSVLFGGLPPKFSFSLSAVGPMAGLESRTASASEEQLMSTSATSNGRGEHQIHRLSTERTALFAKGSGSGTLCDTDRRRLREIEHLLEECFQARRAQRAARDANRFGRNY
jgi:hypothetical protein